jgi:acetyltransferase-like isoleucine patch superfamily enzyme
MITSNIHLGTNVKIDKESSINNIKIGDNTRVASRVKIFGAKEHILEIGKESYVGLNCFIEGFNAKVIIGDYVSFAPNVNLISGSGPNASLVMQKIFPIVRGAVTIGDHTWIGGNSTIMPNVTIGKYCVIAANSFVNKSFPDYSIVGGSPAKLLRSLTASEIEKLHAND